MHINVSKKRKVCIVEAIGRLTLQDGEGLLRDKLSELLETGERRFVFNLDGISVLDSAGVGEVVDCYKRAGDKGAVVKIALRPDGIVRRVLQVSGLEDALEIFDDEQQAIASYA
jgi:anti-sigma B factor antagonist